MAWAQQVTGAFESFNAEPQATALSGATDAFGSAATGAFGLFNAEPQATAFCGATDALGSAGHRRLRLV